MKGERLTADGSRMPQRASPELVRLVRDEFKWRGVTDDARVQSVADEITKAAGWADIERNDVTVDDHVAEARAAKLARELRRLLEGVDDKTRQVFDRFMPIRTATVLVGKALKDGPEYHSRLSDVEQAAWAIHATIPENPYNARHQRIRTDWQPQLAHGVAKIFRREGWPLDTARRDGLLVPVLSECLRMMGDELAADQKRRNEMAIRIARIVAE